MTSPGGRLVAGVIPVVILLVITMGVTDAAAQRDVGGRIRENQGRLNEIRRERNQLELQLDQLRGRAHNLSTEIINLESQKFATTRIVNELERQMLGLTAELDTITFELLLAEDGLSEKRAILNRRVTDIYKRGSLWGFEVLLAAESFGDLLSRYKYLYLVSRQDHSLVGEVETLRNRINSQRNQLINVRTALARSQTTRTEELGRYTALEQERRRRLGNLRSSAQLTELELDSLAQNEDRIITLIAELERARATALARGRTPITTITAANMGSLEWPTDGEVIYDMGRLELPNGTFVNQLGMGIRVPVGTAIRAVAGGRVVLAEVIGTWGRSVLLDHGGYTTMYLFLSSLEVAEDQAIQQGQILGLSGGEASEFGPHIEFQIRGSNGITLDPRNWLRPRS